MKRKAEKLKESRDYSFLFSDDAELPGSSANVQAKTKEVSVINSQTHQPKDTQRKLTCQRPLTSTKPLTCVPRQERVEQRKVSQELTRSPSKHRVISKPPLKQPDQLMKKKKKKKPAKMSENDKLALRMVREMCKTDRYAGRDFEDYDDESMETNFEDIIKEEKRRYTLYIYIYMFSISTNNV